MSEHTDDTDATTDYVAGLHNNGVSNGMSSDLAHSVRHHARKISTMDPSISVDANKVAEAKEAARRKRTGFDWGASVSNAGYDADGVIKSDEDSKKLEKMADAMLGSSNKYGTAKDRPEDGFSFESIDEDDTDPSQYDPDYGTEDDQYY